MKALRWCIHLAMVCMLVTSSYAVTLHVIDDTYCFQLFSGMAGDKVIGQRLSGAKPAEFKMQPLCADKKRIVMYNVG